MVTHEMTPGLRVDDYVSQLSKTLARRTPRRSFLGTMGRLTVAAGAGGAVGGAGALLWAEPASATALVCGGATHSAYCGCSSSTTSCPSGSCQCGCWAVCTTVCDPVLTYYCDCCVSPSCSCTCPCGPRCCFRKEWSGGCGTVGSSKIRCRIRFCSGPRACA
jgi:hypothetical protein